MKAFTLNHRALLDACEQYTFERDPKELYFSFLEEGKAEAIVCLLERANDGDAISGPHPSLRVWGYTVEGPHEEPSVLVGIRDELSDLQLSGLSIAPTDLHPCFNIPHPVLRPVVLCEIVEAVLERCDQVFATLVGGHSLLSLVARAPRDADAARAPFGPSLRADCEVRGG